jgi:hypothetical protein
VISPILSNIYLDRLHKFVETQLIPQYTRGERRKPNPAYKEAKNATKRAHYRGDQAAARQLRKQQRSLPSVDPQDPGFRRLRYIRYADLCRARHKSAYLTKIGEPALARPRLAPAAW